MMLIYRVLALPVGCLLDFILGDPSWLYHPVILIGRLISLLEEKIRPHFSKSKMSELLGGLLEVALVCLICFALPWLVVEYLYRLFPPAAFVVESFLCGQLLAARSLQKESMKVYDALKNGTIDDARHAISMIVGRDTQSLTEKGIVKAAVETIAENTSDGVTAPMLFMAIGGLPFMFLYKAINTMDSMLGYKNDKYLYYGRCAAKLDDVANYIPARVTAFVMILACGLCGLDAKMAEVIHRRDRKKHASPNSAQTESVMAGALHVQLAGDAYYFGKKYEKPTIGDDIRPIEAEDIKKANRLMFATSFLCMLLFTLVSLILRVAGGLL